MSSDDYSDDEFDFDDGECYNDLIDGADENNIDEFDKLAESMHDETSAEEIGIPDDNDDIADDIADEPESEFVSKTNEMEFHGRVVTVVKPNERQTSNIMSKYEITAHTSIRASQIAKYDNCMIDHSGLSDPIRMAEIELMLRKSPLTIRRPVGEIRDPKSGKIEYFYEFWDPNTMGFSIQFDMDDADWNR